MLNEERIIKMSKMAMFEKGTRKTCLKISSYYRRDYIAFQTTMTLLWGTIGYCIIAAGFFGWKLQSVIYDLTAELLQEMVVLLIGTYSITLVILGGIAVFYYGLKYQKALSVAREYYKALGELSTEFKREK